MPSSSTATQWRSGADEAWPKRRHRRKTRVKGAETGGGDARTLSMSSGEPKTKRKSSGLKTCAASAAGATPKYCST
uniref:Uncharacterized protein n=1 Tax=Arundo donax TaxID=35708 RepID=A0A0A9BNY3_ARUDO